MKRLQKTSKRVEKRSNVQNYGKVHISVFQHEGRLYDVVNVENSLKKTNMATKPLKTRPYSTESFPHFQQNEMLKTQIEIRNHIEIKQEKGKFCSSAAPLL